MVTPQQYAVYKGVKGKFGAVQFNFQSPHKYCTKCKMKDFSGDMKECCGKISTREGAVFIDITSAKDKNVYDWDNKVTVALSVTDMGKVLYGIRTAKQGSEIKLMHDPGAGSASKGKIQKHISFSSPNGPKEGFMVRISQLIGGERTTHLVPLAPDEVLVIAKLLDSAIAKALAWN